MKDGKLVAVVLREPDLRIVQFELEPVGRGCGVSAGDVPLGDSVPAKDEAARFIGSLGFGVSGECATHRAGNYHQTVRSMDASTSSASQKSAERYFQPPSAST